MNPLFVILILVFSFLAWAGTAFLFQKIGGFVKDYIDAMKGVIDESEDDNNEDN